MSDVGEMSFESAFGALSEIVERLDTGELTLEQTIALYEQGQLLARHCQELLDDAELRVSQTVEDGSEQ